MDDPGPNDAVLTLGEAAVMLRISLSTAKKLAASGEMPGILPKLGGQWRISRVGLDSYLHSCGPNGTPSTTTNGEHRAAST